MRDFFTIMTNMRNRHYLLFDLLAMMVIPVIALGLRMDTFIPIRMYRDAIVAYTALAILVKLPIYYKFGLYRHLWKYASVEEVSVILIAVTGAGFLFNVIYLFVIPAIPGFPGGIPRSVPWIDLMLALGAHGGVRLMNRIVLTEIKKRRSGNGSMKKVLIIGAGNSGTMIAKEMMRNPAEGLVPVGFIDDDPRKQGGMIGGVPVLGGRDRIPEFCKELGVQMLLIAMPSASGKAIRTILQITEPLKLATKTLPGVSELMSDTVELRQFREIRIDDLLRREPVKTDMRSVRENLADEVVLVTGAGGSIGSEICRHIAQSGPKELILLGHGENSIHDIQRELTKKFPHITLRTVIADIRDNERIDQVLSACRPSYVYHAAAHKHVPLMENNVVDALTNNVLGTISMLRASRRHGVGTFTLISTDKAVRPTSVMGMTKRMAEIALQLSAREDGGHYSAVRFGNVLGSRGSVIPIFMDQIAGGGPITITHPEMRRFFMTIPEAVQLVLQASMLDGNGHIYVLDMGEPERILDLALDLIQLSGLVPYKNIDVKFTGLRPGEKLNEALFRDGEVFTRSRHEMIFQIVDSAEYRANGDSLGGHEWRSLDDMAACIERIVGHNNHFDSRAVIEAVCDTMRMTDFEDMLKDQTLVI